MSNEHAGDRDRAGVTIDEDATGQRDKGATQAAVVDRTVLVILAHGSINAPRPVDAGSRDIVVRRTLSD